jgi:putative FmdB family regulatory protein
MNESNEGSPMPKYIFECQSCTTRFERILKIGDHPTHTCPSCKGGAPRLFSGNGFGMSFKSPPTAAPSNTGVHSEDYASADKIVGRSAEQRWQTYRDRDQVKKKVRAVGGHQALSRLDGDGFTEYAAMASEERGAREKLVDFAVSMEKKPEAKPSQ